LQIDDRIVTFTTKPPRRANERAPSLPRVKRDDIADPLDPLHQIDIAWIDDPIDARSRMAIDERRHRGNRVNDVAEGSQADDQESWCAVVHDD
jgi:hypothetical protein